MKNLVLVFAVILLLTIGCSQPAEEPANTANATSKITAEFKTPLPQASEAQVQPTKTPVSPPPTPTPRPTATHTPEIVDELAGEAEANPGKTPALPSAVTDMMVEIPAGPFIMGNDSGPSEERPAHEVDLKAFEIDVFEVTNADFSAFVKNTGYVTYAETAGKKNWNNEFTDGKDNHPVVRVTWNDAAAYCEWLGKRLPTEAEWEKAARGTDALLYPWGNEWDESKANVKDGGLRSTVSGGSFGAGASPYGIEDMAGNVSEWVADWYNGYPGNTTGDTYFGRKCRVTRGGSWFDDAAQVTTTNRNCAVPEITSVNELGFRCAR